MSYNLNVMRIIEGSLSIGRCDFLELREMHAKNLPESCFLQEFEATEDVVELRYLWWSGEGSGYSYHIFKDEVIPKLKGEARIMEVWAGGDTVEFYWIKNGEKTDVERY